MSDDDFRSLPISLQFEIRDIRNSCFDIDFESERY